MKKTANRKTHRLGIQQFHKQEMHSVSYYDLWRPKVVNVALNHYNF